MNSFYIIPNYVSIIIPTITRKKLDTLKTLFKRRQLLENILVNIKKNVSLDYEIIIVCNSPNDKKLVDYIQTHPDIQRWCLNNENIGVPRSWNQGVHLSRGEFLCFANDDVEIKKGSLEIMVSWLNDPSVGQVGPKGAGWYRKEPGDFVGITKPEEADQISGWLFMTRTSIFYEIGGIDNFYSPAFMEEIDFSFAIRNAGYKCIVDPSINAIHHHISGASSTNKPIEALGASIQREELTQRNRTYFEKKWDKFWK